MKIAQVVVLLGLAFVLSLPGSVAAHDGWASRGGPPWSGSWYWTPYGYGASYDSPWYYGGAYRGFVGRRWGYWTAPPYGWAFGYRSSPGLRPFYRRYRPDCWR